MSIILGVLAIYFVLLVDLFIDDITLSYKKLKERNDKNE